MTFGSLFTGIGGIDLGLEMAGMECIWQVENNHFCNRVLSRHWPTVQRFSDIRTLEISSLANVDIVAGGFPCQDVSRIGKMEGIYGDRSGLWKHFARIIRGIRPRIVIVENVTGLLDGGIGPVLSDLAEIGFNAEWEVLPAAAFGSPQLRERVFIVAYARGERLEGIFSSWTAQGAIGRGNREHAILGELPMLRGVPVPDTYGSCLQLRLPTNRGMVDRPLHGKGRWEAPPRVFRMDARVPGRVDRLRSIGNSVVPQVMAWIGRRILEVQAVQS